MAAHPFVHLSLLRNIPLQHHCYPFQKTRFRPFYCDAFFHQNANALNWDKKCDDVDERHCAPCLFAYILGGKDAGKLRVKITEPHMRILRLKFVCDALMIIPIIT